MSQQFDSSSFVAGCVLRAVVGCGVLFPAGASEAQDGELSLRVAALAEECGIGEETPGAAITVIQEGSVAFQECYGLAHVGRRQAITPETTFELASVSKSFTSMAVMMLNDRGLLHFDDEVGLHLEEFPEYDPRQPIRLVHLLQHTSGLPDYTELDEPAARHAGYLDNQDYLADMSRHPDKYQPRFRAGQKFDDSSTNYMLLGLVVARASGKSYGSFLREELFRPLRMTGTWVYERPDAPPDARSKHPRNAAGYDRRNDGTFEMTWAAAPWRDERVLTVGDGGVWSSVVDLVRWDACLRKGKQVKAKTMQLALAPAVMGGGKPSDYGFGWRVEQDEAGKPSTYWHDGEWGGFWSCFSRDLENDRTIIVLTNCADLDHDRLWQGLQSLFE